MDDFEKKEVEQVIQKPACWFRYVNDTSVTWPHGQEKLTVFLNHLKWISHEYLVQRGKRRPPPIFGYQHLQETRQLPRLQSLSEAHPNQSLYTLAITSPPCKQTVSSGFPDK